MSSKGIQTNVFYPSHKDRKDLKRKLSLNLAENKINKKREFDVLAMTKRPKSIVHDVPLLYKVFARQNEAISFAEHFKGSLKVFAFETESSGKRSFVVCHPERYWTLYNSKDPKNRHSYEVIVESQPCKLYFDIEFKKNLNKDVNSEDLMVKFKDILVKHLGKTFSANLSDDDIIDLDSSTEEKFSRHLIVDLVFVNNHAVGNYVKFLTSEPSLDDIKVNLSESQLGTFIDEGVYTKNRNFRIFLSSKYGKKKVLELAYPTANVSPKDIFLRSLVTNTDKCSPEAFLTFGESAQSKPSLTKARSRQQSSAPLSSNKPSPFSEVDDFIDNIIKPYNGYIRKWSMGGPSMAILTYEIAGGYRYCERILRHHKSNNIRFIIDLNFGTFYQMCHDSDCKGFMSTPKPLPPESFSWLMLNENWSEDVDVTKTCTNQTPIDSDDDFAELVSSNDFLSCFSTENVCKTSSHSLDPEESTFFDDDADEFLLDVSSATEFLH